MGEMQTRILDVGARTFGSESMYSDRERALRFLEEALELSQAAGLDIADADRLKHHVFSRPKGELKQELGGAGVTLYALATAHWIDLDTAIATETNRIEANIDKIRTKAAKKPDFLFAVRPIAPALETLDGGERMKGEAYPFSFGGGEDKMPKGVA